MKIEVKKIMQTEFVKGFQDFDGDKAEKRSEIKKILVDVLELYGFQPAETPVIEYENFVKGSSDQSKDEAISDIFKLEDKGKRKLALRYEFTFQLKRLMKNKKLPYRRYQIGPVFRDEPVSKNRFRQFIQCEADVVGSTIKDEAEMISLAETILEKLGVKSKVYFNNRKLLNEILDEQKIKNKAEVIREIDKLDKLPEKKVEENLRKFKAEKILVIFKKPKSFFKKYESFSEIEELEKLCKNYGAEIEFLPSLARGLSYYTGMIFEIKSNIKESIFGGGTYTFGGVQSTGFGVSIERLDSVSKINLEKEKYLIVSLNQDKRSVFLANKLRKEGKPASLYYGKPSKALQYANSYSFNKVIFVGAKEVEENKFKVKDMKTGKEGYLTSRINIY